MSPPAPLTLATMGPAAGSTQRGGWSSAPEVMVAFEDPVWPLACSSRGKMDIHARLVAIATSATSPGRALEAATKAIAEAFGTEGCALYLRNARRVEQRAQHGAPTAASRSLVETALADLLPVAEETDARAVLAVPIAAIDQAIGAIVVDRASGSPFTTEETMRLGGVASQLVAFIESDRLFGSAERAGSVRAGAASDSDLPPSTEELVLRGIAASPGIAIGRATFRSPLPSSVVRRETKFLGAEAEQERVRDASARTRNELLGVQAAVAIEIGEEQALIFGAQLLLLNDPMLDDLVNHAIAEGRSAPIALDGAFDEIVRRLQAVRDPYIRERIEDIEDLRSRILGHLIERADGEDTEAGARVVVGARTTPSLVVELKARGAIGIASELGGATSHGALLARALGIPAVVGVEALTRKARAGELLVIDGDAGRVVLRPTAETRADYERRGLEAERRSTEFLRFRDLPAATEDGFCFDLQANIALGADLAVARENRAHGIGLYRTEFPFIVRDALPSVDEQQRIYARAYEAFPDGPVTFRLLDLAGDKFVASRQLGVSRDAFHGYRSIRILFDFPHVLRDQVRALALAAAGRELRILVPMVTSVEDICRIKQMIASALGHLPPDVRRGPIVLGAMIETPAAVEIVRELASEVDFFSIGTNDLIQYSLVVDREDPRMASESHAFHPAILRMVRRVVEQAHLRERRVGVCGEMAARPELAIALLAMGVDALSVTPRLIPGLKQALAGARLGPMRASLDAVLALGSPAAIASALQEHAR